MLFCLYGLSGMMLACGHRDMPAEVKKYLFLGHTYDYTARQQKIDPRLEKVDYTAFDLLLLGGDLAPHTTERRSTLTYVDSIFGLARTQVHWAPGNHDYMNPTWITEATGKPLFYTFFKSGICFLVLDTEKDSCRIIGDQLSMIRTVADTIRSSSHLILIHHKLIWVYNSPYFMEKPCFTNGCVGDCSYCIRPNNFYEDVYPLLRKINGKGIEVWLIAGDLGLRSKQLAYRDKENILFLAAGMHEGDENDQALLLHHDVSTQQVQYEFIPVNDLAE